MGGRTPEHWMGVALEAARPHVGRTSPNPPVGCAIVVDDAVVATGAHEKAGAPHAEVDALRKLGMRAEGADLHVTLEPCNHTGRQPPCTDALIAAGLRRVFIGVKDPHPLVNGAGIERLRGAGIEVIVGVEEDACRRLIRPFTRAVTQGLPEVTLKLAATLDGRIADTSGEQRWVSGEEARLHGHGLRNASDSILVGVGTVLADNPRLTTRLPDGREGRDPLRIVVDSRLRTPLDAHLVTAARETPTVMFTCTGNEPGRMLQLQEHGVELVEVSPNTAGRVDCESMLRELCARGHHTLLCEGGGTLGAHLLRSRLVQRVAWYVAPRILGPPHVLALGEPVGVTGLDKPIALAHVDVERFGDDVVIMGDVVYADEEL